MTRTQIVRLVSMLCLGFSAAAFGASVSQPVYAGLDALPDISGFWQMDGKSSASTTVASLHPPVKSELQSKINRNAQNEPSELCKTRVGMPIVMGTPLPFEILMTPGRVTLIFESDGKVRRIYTDGRKRSDQYYPQSMGYSEGHWDGNSLIVTTTDVDDSIPITPMGGVDHGPSMRIDERFTLVSKGVMHVKTVTTDSATLSEPWVVERTYHRDPNGMIFEYSCEQNNRESVDESGAQHVDLTPPP